MISRSRLDTGADSVSAPTVNPSIVEPASNAYIRELSLLLAAVRLTRVIFSVEGMFLRLKRIIAASWLNVSLSYEPAVAARPTIRSKPLRCAMGLAQSCVWPEKEV